ncbi:MAG: MoaF N-terminal domain-containing protein [Sphaerochaetaceae bacterium]|nr:MoaF N-terminal domain-containing protein [Sphaerochaetaceae bacterium]
MTIYERTRNRKLEITYEDGSIYDLSFLSETQLKWELKSALSDWEFTEFETSYIFFEISDGVYTVNWAEHDGHSVSLNINFDTFMVSAEDTSSASEKNTYSGSFEVV